MRWTVVKITPPAGMFNLHRYMDDVKTALVNDDNEVYCHINNWTAGNKEIYVQKNKRTLLVTVGESWTYGEGTKYVNHMSGHWDVHRRINDTYSGHIARMLDSDLWTFSCPGNSNAGILHGLKRILKSIDRSKYDQVKVLVLLTSPDRENIALLDPTDPFRILLTPGENRLHIRDWLAKYEMICLDMLGQIIYENQDLSLDLVVFKNYNEFITSRRDFMFRIIDKPWVAMNAEWHGIYLPLISYCGPGFVETIQELLIPDVDYYMQELLKWEKYVKFFQPNELHQSAHPNEFSHFLWSQYVMTQTGWPVVLRDIL